MYKSRSKAEDTKSNNMMLTVNSSFQFNNFKNLAKTQNGFNKSKIALPKIKKDGQLTLPALKAQFFEKRCNNILEAIQHSRLNDKPKSRNGFEVRRRTQGQPRNYKTINY